MRISIIVNVYAGTEKYISDCLESISAQSEKPFEIILVVDGYKTPMIYDGVTAIVREKNIGVALSRDQGVRLARGSHILFVDADDMLAENFLYEMRMTQQWKKADIIYPSAVLWTRWGDDKTKENGYFTPALKVSFNNMLQQNQIVVTSLIRKSLYMKLKGFDPDLTLYEDWDFFLRAMQAGATVYRANTFLKYRQRTLSRNHANQEHDQRIADKIRNRYKKKTSTLKKVQYTKSKGNISPRK